MDKVSVLSTAAGLSCHDRDVNASMKLDWKVDRRGAMIRLYMSREVSPQSEIYIPLKKYISFTVSTYAAPIVNR